MLCDAGRGITNADVIESFLRTVAAWGAPRGLYLDNGSEYNWAPFIDDALKLTDNHGHRLLGELAPWDARRSNIVRARAYNAAAKPIEGIFRVLEGKYFHAIPGYVGGNRMRKKTANHGREPDPFPGDFEALRELLHNAVALYNAMPQLGSALGGRSPNQALQAAIDAGWGMTAVDPDSFRIAFSTTAVRTWNQGSIRVGGRTWTSRALQAYQGDTVTVLIPKFGDWRRLPIRDEAGRPLGFVEENQSFGFLDMAGAEEAHKREQAHRQGVMTLDRAAPDLNLLDERARLAASLRKPPEPPVVARIEASDEARALGQNERDTPEARKARDYQALLRKSEADDKKKAWHHEQAQKYSTYKIGGNNVRK